MEAIRSSSILEVYQQSAARSKSGHGTPQILATKSPLRQTHAVRIVPGRSIRQHRGGKVEQEIPRMRHPAALVGFDAIRCAFVCSLIRHVLC
jgi:hypothetical protein